MGSNKRVHDITTSPTHESAGRLKLDIMLQAASQKKNTPNGVPLLNLSELKAQL